MGSKVRFFIYPGLYIGARLHSTLDGTEKSWHMGSDAVTRTLDGTADGYYPDFEFGVLAGGGIEVPLTENLGLVYENSVSINLAPVASAWGPGNTKMTDFTFELGVTYTFQ